jgi:hypothetical protein
MGFEDLSSTTGDNDFQDVVFGIRVSTDNNFFLWCPWEMGYTRVMDPLVFPGSDPRLESEIEVARDDALHFRAPADGARVAVYGPYASLPAGEYRIELSLAVSEATPGDVVIELSRQKARAKMYARRCFSWELDRGLIQISYPFNQPVEDLEVRLIVPAGCTGSIAQLRISKRI